MFRPFFDDSSQRFCSLSRSLRSALHWLLSLSMLDVRELGLVFCVLVLLYVSERVCVWKKTRGSSNGRAGLAAQRAAVAGE